MNRYPPTERGRLGAFGQKVAPRLPSSKFSVAERLRSRGMRLLDADFNRWLSAGEGVVTKSTFINIHFEGFHWVKQELWVELTVAASA